MNHRVIGLSLFLPLALAAACRFAAPPVTPPARSPTAITAAAAWVPVALARADGRGLLAAGAWAAGDRLSPGSRSPLWGSAPLGSGYLRGGLLPFVSRGLGGGVFFADLSGKTVYQVPALGPDVHGPVIGRGGRFVVYETGGELEVLDLRTQLVQTFPGKSTRSRDDVRAFDVDAFGNVAYVDGRGRLHLFDPRAGDDWLVPAAGRDVGDVALAPDGDLVYFASGDGRELVVTDLRRGRQLSVPFVGGGGQWGGGNGLRPFAVTRGGRELLYGDGADLRVVDLQSGYIDRLPLLNTGGRARDAAFLDARGEAIAFERDGRLMVYDRRRHVIDTLPIVNASFGDVGLGRRTRFGSLF